MGIRRGSRNTIPITPDKLKSIILEFLTENAVHFQDYKPDSEIWRQQLASILSAYILSQTRT
jgi:hypothetical protein